MQHFDEEENFPMMKGISLRDEIIRNGLKRREIYIYGEINEEMELFVVRSIEKMCNSEREKKEPVTIKISSPGGEIFPALAIVGAIEKAKDDGYTIIGRAYGIVMSAAVNILIACSHRISYRHSRFLLHDLGSWHAGFQSREDIKDSYEEHKELWDRMRMLILKDTKVEPEFLDEIVSRKKEYSFWPNEALELGFIDEIE